MFHLLERLFWILIIQLWIFCKHLYFWGDLSWFQENQELVKMSGCFIHLTDQFQWLSPTLRHKFKTLFYGFTGELFIRGLHLHTCQFLRTQEQGRGLVLVFHWNRMMELPNYSSQLMQQLWALRKEGHFCDCTILVGESSHRAHKLLLAASSMLFRYVLLHHYLSKKWTRTNVVGLDSMCPLTADIREYVLLWLLWR